MKRILLALILVTLAIIAGTAFWIYHDLRTPVQHSRSGRYIEIPRGSSPTFVIKKLRSEGIIKHEWPLTIYLKLTGKASRLKSGDYNFRSPISPLAIVSKLQEGEERLIRVTVIEGWTRWDIANAMSKVPELN